MWERERVITRERGGEGERREELEERRDASAHNGTTQSFHFERTYLIYIVWHSMWHNPMPNAAWHTMWDVWLRRLLPFWLSSVDADFCISLDMLQLCLYLLRVASLSEREWANNGNGSVHVKKRTIDLNVYFSIRRVVLILFVYVLFIQFTYVNVNEYKYLRTKKHPFYWFAFLSTRTFT